MRPSNRHFWVTLRSDIAAVLLIAFIFQFLTPVIVLAHPGENDTTSFEESLRASICQVLVDDSGETDGKTATDAFVCDLCILCSADVTDRNDLLPEVVVDHLLSGPTQPMGATDQVVQVQPISLRPIVPRAPPL